jgi:hypothetical protein
MLNNQMVYKISKKPSADGQELEERHVFATVKTVNSQFARGQATFYVARLYTSQTNGFLKHKNIRTCVFCCYCKAIMKMVLKMQWGALNVGDCWWWLMMDLWPKLWSIHNGFVFTWKLCLLTVIWIFFGTGALSEICGSFRDHGLFTGTRLSTYTEMPGTLMNTKMGGK